MNLNNFNSEYLVLSLCFNDPENMFNDINKNLWVTDYTYNNIKPGNGRTKIKLTDKYKDEYRTNCIEIPATDASITMMKDVILGGQSFTIDFWMNLIPCTSSSTSLDGFIDPVASWISIDWGSNFFIRIYNTGLYLNNNNNFSKSIYGYFRSTNSLYFTNKAYEIISANPNKLFHILLSYNENESSIYANKKGILNFYINGINVVDINKYIDLEITTRDKILINCMNRNNTTPLYISNFRIWDGVALEIDENNKIFSSDKLEYKDFDFSSDGSIKVNYENMIRIK